jgi:hypothetical protein
MCVVGNRGTDLDSATRVYRERRAAAGYNIDIYPPLEEPIAATLPPPLPSRFQIPGKDK